MVYFGKFNKYFMKEIVRVLEKIGNFILHTILFLICFIILLVFIVFYAYPVSPVSAIVILSLITLPTFLKWDTAVLSTLGIIIYLFSYKVEYSEGDIPFLVVWLVGVAVWELSVYISLMSPKRWRKIRTLCKFWFLKLKRI